MLFWQGWFWYPCDEGLHQFHTTSIERIRKERSKLRMSRFFVSNKIYILVCDVDLGSLHLKSRISVLPETFWELTSLKHPTIICSDSLESIPDAIGELSNLEVLYLQYINKCESIPHSIDDFSRLSTMIYTGISQVKELGMWMPMPFNRRPA